MIELPSTRYYGSKRRVAEKIYNTLSAEHIEYDSILDLFGGTGIVSYMMLLHDKRVIYNDIMQFNCINAAALLQTPKNTFLPNNALDLLREKNGMHYLTYIADNFQDIYYTDDENHMIDVVIQNIYDLPVNQRNSAYYILFQSCLIKRPFNLFHRRNLNLRTNYTTSNFGNKKTWEIPFEDLFVRFTNELNKFQFDRTPNVQITNVPALQSQSHADLVYIDTPYFSSKSSDISYHSRYHFLEGLVDYNNIPNAIDFHKSNHEITLGQNSEFVKKGTFLQELDLLLGIHENSIIVLSYTNNGYPTIEELKNLVARHKENVKIIDLGHHSFALNRNNMQRSEILIIGI